MWMGSSIQNHAKLIVHNILNSSYGPSLVLFINKTFNVLLSIFSYPYFLAFVLGAQKNRLIETLLLSTHNICFG